MMPLQPPMPGQPAPEDLQRFIEEQNRQREIQHWYETQMARLETEHRERILKFAAIMCRCLEHEPCVVHSNVMVTHDGSRVL